MKSKRRMALLTKKVQIVLPEQTHVGLKVLAAYRGDTISNLVFEALENYYGDLLNSTGREKPDGEEKGS